MSPPQIRVISPVVRHCCTLRRSIPQPLHVTRPSTTPAISGYLITCSYAFWSRNTWCLSVAGETRSATLSRTRKGRARPQAGPKQRADLCCRNDRSCCLVHDDFSFRSKVEVWVLGPGFLLLLEWYIVVIRCRLRSVNCCCCCLPNYAIGEGIRLVLPLKECISSGDSRSRDSTKMEFDLDSIVASHFGSRKDVVCTPGKIRTVLLHHAEMRSYQEFNHNHQCWRFFRATDNNWCLLWYSRGMLKRSLLCI